MSGPPVEGRSWHVIGLWEQAREWAPLDARVALVVNMQIT